MWNRRNSPSSFGRIGFEFFIDFPKIQQVAIKFLRSNLSSDGDGTVEYAKKLLQDFLYDYLDYLDLDEIMRSMGQQCSLAEFCNENALDRLVDRLPEYSMEKTRNSLYLVPCPRIPCPDTITDPSGLWLPNDYNLSDLGSILKIDCNDLVNEQFPPMTWDGRITPLTETDSWVGCIAPSERDADARIQRMVGALFLALEIRDSLMITGGDLPHGQFCQKEDGRWVFRGVPPVFQPLGKQVKIERKMSDFVKALLKELYINNRLAVALEYAAAAWNPIGRLRFLHIAIAIDALFGENGRVRTSICNGINRYASTLDNVSLRIDLLLEMRNQLLHGEVASLEKCSEYLTYYDTFKVDPAWDQFRILRLCVWNLVGQNLG